MRWTLFRSRPRARRVPSRRFVPVCEQLEDRTVLDAASLFNELAVAQYNQALLSNLLTQSQTNPQVLAQAAQIALSDGVIEQLLFQDAVQVQSLVGNAVGSQLNDIQQQATQILGPIDQQVQALTTALFTSLASGDQTTAQTLAAGIAQLQSQESTILASFEALDSNVLSFAQSTFTFLQAVEAQALTALDTDISLSLPFATAGGVGTFPPASSPTPAPTPGQATQVLDLNLQPIDVNLLGLEVQTSQIEVTVSAQSGQGELLGNLLSDVANLLNLQGVNTALNNVLGSVVTLVNSANLNSTLGVNTTSGALSTSDTPTTTPVLDLFVAPVHLNLLGALVDTSPIHLTITAHSGPGLVLGNVVTDLANLFNPPLPSTLDLDSINTRLQMLLNELDAQIPALSATPTTIAAPAGQILSLSVPPINLNLLGLLLQTSQIQVNADAQTGNGELLGNVLTTLLNTLGATPDNLNTLNSELNTLLADVVTVLNSSSLTIPLDVLGTLTPVLQELALPNLVTSATSATTPILNLNIASTDGTTPPVDVNLLGLQVTTSNIQAQLLAQTGTGQILGNLLYNVANLLNPGGSLNLLSILDALAL